MRTVVRVRNHRIGGYDDTALPSKLHAKVSGEATTPPIGKCYLLFLIGGEYGDLLVCYVGPLKELLSPLHHGYATQPATYETVTLVSEQYIHLRGCA